MKNLLLILATVLVVSPVFGQQAGFQPRGVVLDPSAHVDDHVSTPIEYRHATLELFNSPEGREAMDRYYRMRAEGKLPVARKGFNDPIGTVRTFSVGNFGTTAYDTIEFIKKAEGPGFSLWVETAEIDNGHVLDEDIEAIAEAAASSTPFGSVDEQKGIIENNVGLFGPAPDVDGDGIVDILLLDIRDGYPQDNRVVSGFLDPNNFTGLNMRDIVHLDTYPSIVTVNGDRGVYTSPSQTFAHEHQHLLFATQNSFGDLSFVNEGLSEWAETVNGYPGRPISYYQAAAERTRHLLDWVNNSADYQRSGLFTQYVSQRIGIAETAAMSRSVKLNHQNYVEALTGAGLDFNEVILDFHTANILNDQTIAPEFGYTIAPYSATRVNSIPEIDGTQASSTPAISRDLHAGGVYYFRWNTVADLQLELDTDFSKMSGHLILKQVGGQTSVIDLEETDEGVFITGDYESITLVLTNNSYNLITDVLPVGTESFEFISSWSAAQSQFLVEDVIYDDGFWTRAGPPGGPGQLPPNLFTLDHEWVVANRVEVPTDGILNEVGVDVVYLSDIQSSGVAPGQPRNLTLKIWADNGAGIPGDELFSLEFADTSPLGLFTLELEFMTVSLAGYEEQLANLPDVIYVGIGNAGDDPNDFLFLISEFPSGDSPSFLSNGTIWRSFSELDIGGDTLGDKVLPIRTRFLIPTEPVSVAEATELPERVTLQQNYPNPFNPATTIEFSMPDAGDVRLTVYDILGREVETLVEDFRGAGVHHVSFDASRLSSGLYLYALETAGEKVTRTMTLLK